MSEPSAQIEDEQQRIANLLHSFDAPAPESLHRRIESLLATHSDRRVVRPISTRRPFSRLRLASLGAVVAVIVAIAITVGLSGGGTPALSVRQAAAASLRAATLPAPPESQAHHAQLAAAVDGVAFPYWGERFGWHSTGARTDLIGGRTVTTVFYENDAGQRIGYAILAGAPAPRAEGGVIAWRDGVSYRLLSDNGAVVVTWLRDGHLCIVSGRNVSSATLLRLASWSDRDTSAA